MQHLQNKKKIDETLKHASQTLAKTPEKHLKIITNIHNIQIKQLRHMCDT
jgi:hypothetical protein